jgi:hypothetical protein
MFDDAVTILRDPGLVGGCSICLWTEDLSGCRLLLAPSTTYYVFMLCFRCAMWDVLNLWMVLFGLSYQTRPRSIYFRVLRHHGAPQT